MLYNRNGVDNGLRIYAYYNNGWYADIENDRGLSITETLPSNVKHHKGVELWVKRYIHKNHRGERAFLSWIYNHGSKDDGLVISVHEQGSQWIADVTTNKIDYWQEIPLHYSINSLNDVIDWAVDYADGRRLEFRD